MSATADRMADAAELGALSARERRGLTERLTVHPHAPGMWQVYAEDGTEYIVDVEGGTCSCPDAEYNDPEDGCKHRAAVEFALGVREVPAAVDDGAIRTMFTPHAKEAIAGAGGEGR